MNTLKRFIRYYKPYKLLFYTDMLCAAGVSAVDLIVPAAINNLVKNVFSRTDTSAVLRITLIMSAIFLAMYLIRFFCQHYISTWGHIMGARMETDMRSELFSHLEKLSFSYYDKNNTGQMMSRIISDLFDISELAHHGPEDVFISLLKIIGSFVILLLINLHMTLILLAVTVIMLLVSLYYNKHMHRVFMDNRKKIADVNSVVQDSLSGIRVVKAFSNEELEQQKFDDGNLRFLESKKSSYTTMGRYFSINGLMQGMMYLSVILAGGLLICSGKLAGSDIIVYILYIGMFLDPINKLVNFTEQFQKGLTGFKRMTEIVDTAPDVLDKPDAKNLTVTDGEIVFDRVSFAYDDKQVLDDVSFTAHAGKTLALVGPSGSGKSTICSLIPRFYDVISGAIRIDGTDIRDVTQDSLRRNIGIVQQDVYLFNSTVRENIAYGKPDATDEEIIQAARKANIHDFIMSLDKGYDTHVGERGVRFSGGQKQRISIARAFLKNPTILILDEATSALDNESEKYIQESLARLTENRTTLIIAHRLSTIRNADEIIVLTKDGIAERGSHDELMAKDKVYAQLYRMQFENIIM